MEKLMKRKGITVMLEDQYRMNDVLVKFPSLSMYEGKLKSHPSVANRLLAKGSTEDYVYPPLEFIDTAGCGYEEDVHPETKSVNNREEAVLLLDHLSGLMLALQKSKDNVFDYSIGVISPYSRQVQVLNELLSEHPILSDFKNIKVKTIDGFQGREKDIIYISLVRSNNMGDIGFLQEIRRLNVAITRAKLKLVVFGDSATICSHPYYNQFVEFCQENHYAKSAWDFIYRNVDN
jgi:superfamily I DNA and/or RNA helicase